MLTMDLFMVILLWSSSSMAQNFPFVKEASDVPDFLLDGGFDYIIVGGGTAGCPLAATLSQNYKVLVLERGGSPYGNPNTTRLELFGNLLANDGPNTPNQIFISTDGVFNGRARVLGGGSSINAGFYSRAEPCFISYLGLEECLVEDSYIWVENVVARIPQQLGPYQAAFRASLLQAGITPDNGATYDHLVGTKTGGTIFDESGTRRPSSNLLVYANPSAITVLLHATVQRVLLAGGVTTGVEFVDGLGRTRTILLSSNPSNEVIITAGAIGSPQLLMLSGIGPSQHLQSKGIDLVLDAPEVGKEMADNPTIYIITPSSIPVEASLTLSVGIMASGSYIEGDSGGTLAPGAGALVHKVNGPFSKGFLYLNTTNASDNPIVTFNYFSVQRDVEVCIGGVDKVEEVVLSSAYTPYRYGSLPLPSGGTVASPNKRNATFSQASINNTLADYCRNNVQTLYHYHGGCLVGKVVDSNFKVLGVRGLRVIDGSTFIISPGTNPQATLMMLGRYMGVKIHEGRTGRENHCSP